MAIDFPSSPAVGDTYTFNGRTWTYNSQGGWQRTPTSVLINDIPDGRLTLTTATPVLSATVSGAGTVYYTPYLGNNIPIYDGTNWTLWAFAELSNVLANSSSGSAGPAAVAQDSAYDLFVWNNAGTLTLTRGPAWTQSASVTCTSASPGVFTWTSHGLHDGSPFYFTGTAPTGLAQNTTYYITKVDANTFKVSSSMANQVAGTYINTSSTGSGLTGFNQDNVRGTGAGTTQLTRQNGILTNTVAITNGPAAGKGTYVGTIRTNPSSTCDFIIPTTNAANCTAGVVYLWNMYNRMPWTSLQADSTDTWNYVTASIRAANASATARTSFIVGQAEGVYAAVYNMIASEAGTVSRIAIGYDTTTAFSGTTGAMNVTTANQIQAVFDTIPAIGWHYMSACEYTGGATSTFNGDAGVAVTACVQTGMFVRGWY